MPRMYACAVYISSGVASVATRAAQQATRVPRVAVVDTFTDVAYARSSVKLVAEGGQLVTAARAVIEEALSLVDLSNEPHPAPHPRCGAVDMVAFMPLSESSASASVEGLHECDALAWQLAHSMAELRCPLLLYGTRAGRSLLEVRPPGSLRASHMSVLHLPGRHKLGPNPIWPCCRRLLDADR